MCEKSLDFTTPFVILLVQTYACLLLVGPRIDDADQRQFCVINLDWPGPLGLSLNCDSPEFLRVAADPRALLEPSSVRQSRPGLPVAAWLITRPVVGIRSALDMRESEWVYFGAYFLINVVLLYSAWRIYHACLSLPSEILKGASWSSPAGWLSLCLIFNFITKDYLWSPHTQLFNILVPLICLYAFMLGLQGLLKARAIIILASLSGIGMLFYGTFILVLPAVGVGLFMSATSPFFDHKQWAAKLIFLGCLSVPLLAPSLLWIQFVVSRTGAFYQHEIVAYNQLVWVYHDFRQHGVSTVLQQLFKNLCSLFRGAWTHGSWLFPLALIILMLSKLRPAVRTETRVPGLIPGALMTSGLFAMFFGFVGLTPLRVSYCILPPLLVLIGSLAHETAGQWAMPNMNRRVRIISAIVICCRAMYVALCNSLYS